MTGKLKCVLQHRLNSMHVYSVLRSFMTPRAAIVVCRTWEKMVHPIIYRKTDE